MKPRLSTVLALAASAFLVWTLSLLATSVGLG